MKDNKISITVDWDLEYDEASLNRRIEDTIVREATKKYLENLEKSFGKKLEKMLHDQAFKIVKNINKFELDKCNSNGIKETISMEDFIIKKSIESLEIKRDEYGRTGHNARNEQRTMIEWVVKDMLKGSENSFKESLKNKIQIIEKEYQDKLQDMVTTVLTPIYTKLIEKLNS